MRTLSVSSIARPSWSRSLAILALAALPALPVAADEGDSYGYLRVVEGPATLLQAESGTRSDAEINQPLLTGDRLQVPRGSRVEAVLSDGSLLRIDGGTDIGLARLAGSPDADARSTLLELDQGNVLLVVFDDALGDELPRIDTPNATFYVQQPGTYRLSADQGTWSSFVVREGSGQVVTERGSVAVRADEEAEIEGERFARASVRPASSRDALERWAERLDEDADRYASRNDLGDLSYQGASLGRYGSWLTVDHRRVWRPTVDGGWHPYWHGRWGYTPAGLNWISYEPWGWVPYHYGSWDFLPGYGWVWEPGYVWAPAWVYWYWGPRYVSWCPVGYYTHYYGHHVPGFRSGVYGWAGGGGWDGGFDDWTFVERGDLGRRDQYAYSRKGRDLGPKLRELGRGIVTTDTRGITPERWKDPEGVLRVLRERGPKGGELPDVTPFVAREPKLPAGVLRTVQTDRPVDGTPMKPATLGPKGLGHVRPERDRWGSGGSGPSRPTIQIGGGRNGGGQETGGRTADGPRVRLPEQGAGSSEGVRPGKTWDRGDRGESPGKSAGHGQPKPKTWDRGDDGASGSGPRVRQPEGGTDRNEGRGESGSEGRGRPKASDRGSSGGSDSGPRVRLPERGSTGSDTDSGSGSGRAEPASPTWSEPAGGGSDSGSSGPRVREPESRPEPVDRGRDHRDDPPAKSWNRSEAPRVRSAEPTSRPTPTWDRPASDRPAPAPRVRSAPSAPAARPASPQSAPAARTSPPPPAPPQVRPAPESRSDGPKAQPKAQPKGDSGSSKGRVRPPRERDR